ncbi:MAG: hypothetical protein GY826_00500, partial [Fuerstiella sp.]|nr:hypothetical protein [Fuerstiella sp.]
MKALGTIWVVLLLVVTVTAGDTTIETAATRFTATDISETPDFQRHVVPL